MKMKLHSGLTFLLLVALTHAAPHYWPQDDDIFGVEEEKDEDNDNLNPDTFYNSNPVIGSTDLNFNEDDKRRQENSLLFQRLFGQGHTSAHRPSWFLPWSIPDYTAQDRPSLNNPFLPNNDNGYDSLFDGFPFLGIDRPLFPDLPSVPGIGFTNLDDLPDNYSNETYEVLSVNGTKVFVNNTIYKESGDNVDTFFHQQVIEVRPEGEGNSESTTEVPVTEIPEEPVTEIPQESEEDSDDEINTVLPEVDVSQPEDPVTDD